ncbi:MAG: prolipoprotein diacylglyceryl transferase [Firmicutes bacterium]|nr:prolipoprotein diacylglyceryl transferase [Bacillota bacterium]
MAPVIPGIGVSTFAIFTALGFVAFILIFVFALDRHHKVSIDELCKAIVIAFVSIGIGVGSAAMLDAIVHYIQRRQIALELSLIYPYPEVNVSFTMAGISWYGMLIGGLSSFAVIHKLFAKKLKLKLGTMQYLNLVALGMCLGHAFGRIGCFMGGCCYGGPTDSVFGVVYPDGAFIYRQCIQYGTDYCRGCLPVGTAVWPVQLFETAGLLLVFCFMLFAPKFGLLPKKLKSSIANNRIFIYLIGYSILRFLLEFLRGDNRGGIHELSPGQFISIIVFSITISLWVLTWFLSKRKIVRAVELRGLAAREGLIRDRSK